METETVSQGRNDSEIWKRKEILPGNGDEASRGVKPDAAGRSVRSREALRKGTQACLLYRRTGNAVAIMEEQQPEIRRATLDGRCAIIDIFFPAYRSN